MALQAEILDVEDSTHVHTAMVVKLKVEDPDTGFAKFCDMAVARDDVAKASDVDALLQDKVRELLDGMEHTAAASADVEQRVAAVRAGQVGAVVTRVPTPGSNGGSA